MWHTLLDPDSLNTHVLFYLAVSSSDHVHVVADQFESEASVHQSEATLQRETDVSKSQTEDLAQMEKSIGNNSKWKQFSFLEC